MQPSSSSPSPGFVPSTFVSLSCSQPTLSPRHPRFARQLSPPLQSHVPSIHCSLASESVASEPLAAQPLATESLAVEPLAFQLPVNASPRLQRLLTWFIGDFDNFYQVEAEMRAGVSYRNRHEHMHCRLTPVLNENLTASGEAVVFANYYYNGNPQIVYRQRMYKFLERDDCIEMRIYKMTYIHGLRVSGANTDFSSFDLGSLDDTGLYEYLSGAEIFWNYVEEEAEGDNFVSNGPHFIGTMHPGGWKSSENGLTIDDRLVLTKEDLWVAERMFNADGIMVAGNAEGIPHKMQRVRSEDEIKWTMDDTVPPVAIPQ